jgi:hypothetical protein
MADLSYYAAKIAECLRMLESSNDPLYRDVYRAMAAEFTDKYEALSRQSALEAAGPVPPSPLLIRVPPPDDAGEVRARAGRGAAERAAGSANEETRRRA